MAKRKQIGIYQRFNQRCIIKSSKTKQSRKAERGITMKTINQIIEETADKILSDVTVTKDKKRMEKLYTEYFNEVEKYHGTRCALDSWFKVLRRAGYKLEKDHTFKQN